MFRDCRTVPAPSPAQGDRVVDADFVGAEQRLSHLQARLSSALAGVRQARERQEATVTAVAEHTAEASSTSASSAPDEASRATPENGGNPPAEEPVAPQAAPASPAPA